MAGELETMTREFFAALDLKDFDRLLALSTDDVQIVDEISRSWLRGRQPIAAYLHQLAEEVTDIDSAPGEIHAEHGDVELRRAANHVEPETRQAHDSGP
jgi:ketosteroid isomerase-like protein